MKTYSQAAFYLYAFVLIIMFFAGLIYASTDSFMPYHAEVVEQDWHDLTPGIQLLINSSLNTAGIFMLIQSISLFTLLLTQYRNGVTWVAPAICLIVLSNVITVMYVSIKIDLITEANPPWPLLLVLISLTLLANTLSWQHAKQLKHQTVRTNKQSQN